MLFIRIIRVKVKQKVNQFLFGSLLCFLNFYLVNVYLYSLIPSNYHISNNFVDGVEHTNVPNITIFSVARPFTLNGSNLSEERQELAVRSWLTVSPTVNVVLFGQEPFVGELARKFGERVSGEPSIDFSFSGIPFFHSMLARSHISHFGISILIEPETILLPDIIETLLYVQKLKRDWFIVSVSPSISHFPFFLDESGKKRLQKDGKHIAKKKLQEYIFHNSKWKDCGQKILMAWNNRNTLLHAGVVPPFLYGKGLHNQWLVHEILSSDFRLVIDASLVATTFFIGNLRRRDNGIFETWGYGGNHHLASLYGSLYFNRTTSAPQKLIKCSGKFYLQSQKPFNCIEREAHCSNWHKISLKVPVTLNYSMSLEHLLKVTADVNKTVVLAVAGDNYRDMLMNWVCRLRNLAVTNFIVCALDPDIYQFSVLQGLPVFKDPLAPTNISFDDCHFGTKCFQRVTKVKSRIVLQILELGYNVLMSDVDVYWFRNPLPFLSSFGPGIFLAQSDEYKKKGPINLPRRLNSGFYFARSDAPTITAMKMVVQHASTSDLSEQPSFYDVLCGEGGSNRVGDDRCLEPKSKLNVIFLNRTLFPNGAYKGIWEKSNVKSACMKLGCIVIHNNWISGRSRKFDRQLRSKLWEYDSGSRMCIQHWHSTDNGNF